MLYFIDILIGEYQKMLCPTKGTRKIYDISVSVYEVRWVSGPNSYVITLRNSQIIIIQTKIHDSYKLRSKSNPLSLKSSKFQFNWKRNNFVCLTLTPKFPKANVIPSINSTTTSFQYPNWFQANSSLANNHNLESKFLYVQIQLKKAIGIQSTPPLIVLERQQLNNIIHNPGLGKKENKMNKTSIAPADQKYHNALV